MSEIITESPVLSCLDVIADRHRHSIRDRDPDDSWDRGSTETCWSIDGLRLVEKFGDVTADFEVKHGDYIYLVYAIYSTGDSFGHDRDACCEYITVHKNRALAEQNAQLLRDKRDRDDDWKQDIQTDTGIVIPYYIPWLGYFESLTGVYVKEFRVTS